MYAIPLSYFRLNIKFFIALAYGIYSKGVAHHMFDTAVIFKTCISSAKLPRSYPGNMSDLYFRFANLYLNVLRIIYLPKCLLSLSFLN